MMISIKLDHRMSGHPMCSRETKIAPGDSPEAISKKLYRCCAAIKQHGFVCGLTLGRRVVGSHTL